MVMDIPQGWMVGRQEADRQYIGTIRDYVFQLTKIRSADSDVYLYHYKNQGCVCVCVSCLCRPPSHWWISFIFYTIIGLDPEGGQWLFKFKSNNNNKINQQNAKQYMWDCSINLWNRKHTNSDTVVGFENEMVSTVPVTWVGPGKRGR